MKIAVFGATGGTGRCVVEQALAEGHEVTAFCRRAEALGLSHPRLTVVAGDAFDAAAVEGAVRGREAVVTALGTRPWRHRDVCSVGARHIVAAMKAAGARRLVCVSSFGVGESRHWAGLLSRLVFATLLRRAFADKERMEEIVRGSGLDWVLVRPVILTSKPGRGVWRAAVDGSLRGGRVARADVADFVIHELTAHDWLGRAPTLAA